jgi:osmotically inducible lipoprotein OsmB
MTKHLVAIVLAFAASAGLSACATRDQTVGTVGGAAVGAGVGNAVTGGSALGTIGGAAVGGAVGNEAGRRYEERHK